jgi:hypothetical protein
MEAMTTSAADDEIRSRMANRGDVRCTPISCYSMQQLGGIDLDLQDGNRTDGTGKGRETPVTNGHSRSTTVTRKPGLTRGATL